MYILLTELESTGSVSCKIKGNFPALDLIEKELKESQIVTGRFEEFFEADTHAIRVLNMLDKHGFKILGQSMVIEKSDIGGRTVQTQKIVWTLSKLI